MAIRCFRIISKERKDKKRSGNVYRFPKKCNITKHIAEPRRVKNDIKWGQKTHANK